MLSAACAPAAAGGATLTIRVRSDLNLATEYLSLRLDGVAQGELLFVNGGSDCPDRPDQATFVIPPAQLAALVADGRLAGAIALRDMPRDDAKAGLAALEAMGIGRVMLTGDNEATAAAIGGRLGIEARAGLKPEDKLEAVRAFQALGEVVAKVGDGINDAPALAAADIGIAMGGGTDVALETADAAVLHGRVADVAAMIVLSRRVMANIRQNIAIALGLKAVFLVTTIAGVTGLWPAILADTGATVLVTMNALRLLAPTRN
jgi:Cd2+/Zn2+-exporting ATPase